MDAREIKLLELIGQNKKTFSIPVYQRNYDWKKEECKRLFEDILSLVNSSTKTHFLGTIVYTIGASEANFSEFIVIDGQQRLTTIMLMLKAVMDVADDESLKEEIYEDYLTNKRSPEKYRLKLKTVKSDREMFSSIIDNKEVDDNSNVKKNYDYFYAWLNTSNIQFQDFFDAMHKLTTVYIQLDRTNENPQLIFESLNSTGLDLTPADLIRNYLLMGHSYDKQSHLYNEYWARIESILPNSIISSFIRDFLTLKTYDIPREKEVYFKFKSYCKQKNYNSENIESLFKELLRYTEWYGWIQFLNSPNEKLNQKLYEISIFKSTVAYPYILCLLNKCYSKKEISEDELILSLNIVITYLFRRLLCDYPSNALNKVFNVLERDIEKSWNSELTYAQNLAVLLLNKKGKATMPNDEYIKQYLPTKDFYNFKQKHYFFYKLESYDSKEIVERDNLTIEHIMPQNLSPKWRIELGKNYENIHEKFLHTIGNLTLTGYNSELSNKAFEDKKQILISSNIKTNRMLAECTEWNDVQIIKRANEIINVALRIWNLPEVEEKYLNKDRIDISGDIDINDDINVTGKNPYQITFLGENISVNSWRDMMIKTCEFFYEYDYEVFLTLINHSDFTGRNRVIISDSKGTSGTYHVLGGEIFVQTNLSANTILNYIRLIVDKFEGFSDETTYRVR